MSLRASSSHRRRPSSARCSAAWTWSCSPPAPSWAWTAWRSPPRPAQAITWLLISLVLFLIPYGMLVAELGAAFPVEGGPYEWVKMSSGRLTGSITAVLYWLANPIWVGGTLAAVTIATLNDFVLSKPLGTTGEIVVGLIFTWVTVGTAIVAFRYGKWAPNIGTIVKIAVVGIFTILFIVFLVRHGRPAGASTAADLAPSVNGFLTVIGD